MYPWRHERGECSLYWREYGGERERQRWAAQLEEGDLYTPPSPPPPPPSCLPPSLPPHLPPAAPGDLLQGSQPACGCVSCVSYVSCACVADGVWRKVSCPTSSFSSSDQTCQKTTHLVPLRSPVLQIVICQSLVPDSLLCAPVISSSCFGSHSCDVSLLFEIGRAHV